MIILRNLEDIAFQQSSFEFYYQSWEDYEMEFWHGWLSETEKGNIPIGPTLLCEWKT